MAASAMFRRSMQKLLARNYSSKGHNVLSHGDPKELEAAEKMWRNLTIFGVPVALLLAGINCYLLEKEEEHHPRPEFIPYEHLRIRTKKFPWGDGNHSLFHDPKRNPLPDGYEE
ncbi:cytochrome c oxidase subunit 6A2, mitochondrial [Copidosoma floridanum]|uniref:cytochrome c oxidase subunit 6A2, mitochondrial n=1 Tax=Copidosoma floridanum TaxID=29053 RepID=UPI0006C9740F|nr:cytochrome c oxidase subunit 6A2, mitochondrial [Copidosoma floridanum]